MHRIYHTLEEIRLLRWKYSNKIQITEIQYRKNKSITIILELKIVKYATISQWLLFFYKINFISYLELFKAPNR